ncbi:PAN3 [Auxenochlorella protothecoides x Auxenochlorella symbiontica]
MSSQPDPTASETPRVFKDVSGIRNYSREQRKAGKRIGFVPTMGCLHDGHISLVHAAGSRCDVVIASIYVNPTQFSANEDFGVYPRSTERDLDLLAKAGCVAVFMPAALYHPGSSSLGSGDASMVVGAAQGEAASDAHSTWVNVEGLSQGLCAGSRPHFFRGVATVVTKLFNIVEPDMAFFGKKDYQQWRILERLAHDLDFGIEVVGLPIQREADGLAMSSRNVLLAPDHRAAAPGIYKALRALEAEVATRRRASGTASALTVQEAQRSVSRSLEALGGAVDYVQLVDAASLRPLAAGADLATGPHMVLLAVAVVFGRVRLIDNLEIQGRA